jgi:hypothetical protein
MSLLFSQEVAFIVHSFACVFPSEPQTGSSIKGHPSWQAHVGSPFLSRHLEYGGELHSTPSQGSGSVGSVVGVVETVGTKAP